MEVLIVFLRALNLGRVKTRLAASIGDEAAVRLYEAMLWDLAAKIHGVYPQLQGPRFSRAESRPMIAGSRRFVVPYVDSAGPTGPFHYCRNQSGETVFHRMAEALEECIDNGAERALLVGTDIPLLTNGVLAMMFEKLKTTDVVLGPSSDGGYFAAGFSAGSYCRDALLSAVDTPPWEVRDTTADSLIASGARVAFAEDLQDVDTLADLQCVLADPRAAWACRRLLRTARLYGVLATSR